MKLFCLPVRLLVATHFLISCSRTGSEPAPVNPPQPPPVPVVSYNYKSQNAYSLNVVYFVPNDVVPPADYHRRLSEILLDAQSFIGKEMERNGYAGKTLGLMKDVDKKRIKLVVIKAGRGGSAYPYDGGANAVMQEIAAYRQLNQSEFHGDHYLVIMPATTYDPGGEPGGVPFYGLGKYCFALDYADQDVRYLGSPGTLGTRATKWIGGMIHELGHGLNLPHNCQKVSEESTLGMALMWAGNSTWGNSKTFLTAADCAVLNVNQVFSQENKSFYGEVKSSLQSIYASYEAGKNSIVVKGRFSANTPVTDIIYFNDPNVNNEGTGVNRDYNAVTWTSKPIGQDSFFIEMPVTDLKYRENHEYELKVKLAHTNGVIRETIFSYRFANGLPILDFSTRPEISKTGWSITSFSSEEKLSENGAALNLIDGDPSTYWHSRWSSAVTSYPHEVVVSTGVDVTAKGISISQRQTLSRSVKDMDIFTSLDGVNFVPAISRQLANTSGPQYLEFAQPVNLRFIKLVAKSSWDGEKFAALGEIGLF
ncbi:discoidin domain-containing protein [Flavihumibacter stibioxidans]|nr:discoidin domain-containing protein [Flavihumibacter stibioxidans]